MSYSLVILNYNNSDDTVEAVKRMIPFKNLDYIVVVDNGSPYSKVQLIKDYISGLNNSKVILIQNNENGGYAKGNNVGLKFLKNDVGYTDVVIVMNPDVAITEHDIDKLVDAFEVVPNAFIAPKNKNRKSWWNFTNYNRTIFIDFLQFKFLEKNEDIQINSRMRKVDVLSGAMLAAKMATWDRVGFFDTNTFLYGEEEILQYKARKKGIESFVLLDISYNHVGGGSTIEEKGSVKKDFVAAKRTQESRKYYFSQYLHVGKVRLFILSIIWFFYTILSLFKRSINRYKHK